MHAHNGTEHVPLKALRGPHMCAGDIYPATITETVISLCIIIVGLVFFGLLLGSIASSLQACSLSC